MIRCRHWRRAGVEGLTGVARAGQTPWHSHRHAIFGFVDSGGQTIELRTRAAVVAPGMGFVLPRGLAHRCLYPGEARYRILALDTDRPLAFAVFASPSWAATFDRAFDAFGRPGAVEADRLIDAAAAYSTGAISPRRSAPPFVEQSLAELDADLEDAKRLSDLARRQGLSPFYLQRTFLRHVGLTPSQARVVARVRASRLRLADGMRPTEVAYLCGFADQSHLTRMFAAFMGVTPRRYQRQVARAAGHAQIALIDQ